MKRKELSKKVVDSKGTGFIGRVLLKGRELKRTCLKESLLRRRKNCITRSASKGCD